MTHGQHDIVHTVEDLARIVVRVTDNGGETADRYTVYMADRDCLCMSGAPEWPQGVSMWAQYDPAVVAANVERGDCRDIHLTDLPPHVLTHTMGRINEGYRDWVASTGDGREACLDFVADEVHGLLGEEYVRDVLPTKETVDA